ncbi:YcaO-like family protein [Clostridium fallax]|uniref:Thiazole/oxazole-forming peptide maturase, SagD family component n=1 Tax=Clostridium fallax TaxID=1533 RepID=A0A1M4Y6E5_9CLOT|nr:YcaO-like family protein [Clostridium fallax]SHF01032.1 thiazole/oxazole-forming peptide maturase, SagD family component [Clostridium fallax]SQB07469.1 streptolysin associated protein SagD [Clostridium fallax]
MKFYPSFNKVLSTFNKVSGNQSGIIKATAMPLINQDKTIGIKSITGNMPKYHKSILKRQNGDVQYHIIGYGNYYEESLIKYTGESIERYSSMVAPKLIEDKIVYGTYKEMCKKGKVMPLKYIDVFTENQLKEISKNLNYFSSKRITEDDVIGWVKCPSLIKKDEDIWVPASMLFVGYEVSEDKGEKQYIQGFSTGTASHIDLKKALINAIVEYLQIDSFMITWHCKKKCKKIKIDDEILKKVLDDIGLYDKSVYEIIPLYMTLEDNPVPTFGTFLRRKDKKIPYLLFGLQGDFDIRNGLYRSIMEGVSIAHSGYFNTIYNRQLISHVMNNKLEFLDLDLNVLFYSTPELIDEKNKLIDDFIDGEINLSDIKTIGDLDCDNQIKELIKAVKEISEYAVYLDITSPELRDKGWYTMRVLIPEILEMCIPEFPFKNHPRMIQNGGVINEYPHPMP